GGTLDGATIAVLGLTFKAHTDDLRDSPSIAVVTDLVDAGAKIRAYDPTVKGPFTRAQQATIGPVASSLQLCDDPLDACSGVDAVVVLTEWPEFAELDLDRLASIVAGRASVVDARNLLDPAAVRAAGLTYVGVGRR
ncbi:MAG: UDP binding domain-containing protein, partial [Actinomycetota bacterium]|nr:UDP binding domain-containing protein [Actinomycetota bacterium]